METPQRQVNIYDAKSRLCRLIADVEKTRSGVVIARNGRPVAELLPLRATEFTPVAG
jgi:antitoxin (DNA-binding transcriptional repressor) of toxin-antitoxin stability system